MKDFTELAIWQRGAPLFLNAININRWRGCELTGYALTSINLIVTI